HRLKLFQSLRVDALIPVDVTELVSGIAPKLVLWRGVTKHLLVEGFRKGPLGWVGRSFLEEQLTESQICSRHVLRVRGYFHELLVRVAGLLHVAALLVLK